MERKVRDSCGKSVSSETPQAHRRRGGSRTARGKRVPGVEINVAVGIRKSVPSRQQSAKPPPAIICGIDHSELFC
ncbi:UNVERIFIED_CONTAM: hypothetical protein FO527_23410 [Bacillus sp. ATCC 13368]|uniref:Uncharacterized protein n=1 Tax=Peribacillus frigoritolerans TaxID=450367 RepID=A0AAJ1VAZ7_9BACI|nr:hypothetical protein [Peribacillus frigoritolerans]MDM5282820.1 hypothetical protein [Peribacillus frigoritolerans]USK66014.1 hypothetical protein LIT26_05050 [Peribacillus frigoritolerans]